MGDDSQSGNGPEWRSLMRIDGYAVKLSAVFQQIEKQRCWQIVFLKASYVHETSLKASFVATVSTERYRFDFRLFCPVGACPRGLFSDWLSLSSTHSVLSQCWAVENAHKNMYISA